VKIPENLKTISEAKAMGDLSENFEYKSALEEKDLINSRLKQINELLDNVEIIDNTEKKDAKAKVVEF
jgi:transcription elongation factor GreA